MAGDAGGFATVGEDAVLVIERDAAANARHNTPQDIQLIVGGRVMCGSSSSYSWAPGRYTTNGPICRCCEEFEQGRSGVCDGCGSSRWNDTACACVSIVTGWEGILGWGGLSAAHARVTAVTRDQAAWPAAQESGTGGVLAIFLLRLTCWCPFLVLPTAHAGA